MVRASLVLACLVAGLVGCSKQQIPQHSGYKGKKPTPWTKAKVIELDDEFAAKVEGELDYGAYKRAKWFSLTLPGPGTVVLDLESVPAGDAEMDIAFEVIDKNGHALARADADAEDVNEQKKQRKLPDLDEGTYLIHVYLQGRLDAADFELKLKFTRGEKPWKTDVPTPVSFLVELPTVPPVDDTPAAPVKVVKTTKRPRKIPTTTTPTAVPTGKQPVLADITDVQPTDNGSKIVIGGGTSDGLDNGMRGSVTGLKSGGSFTLTGCNANRCFGAVKASVDDVRSSGTVIVRP
jgi:hypothetical protein